MRRNDLCASPDDELRRLYSQSQAYIFAAVEDAGIMIVEAQACGTPVIAYGVGGALETVKEGITGNFFYEQTVAAITEKVKYFNTVKYESKQLREHAMQYDKKNFQRRIKEFVEEKLNGSNGSNGK